ncbi:MAG: hypothetical protein BWY85_02346 [Firmicutes bacterium ADurb.Bin506]|nr:MAG: hypothetical protein BWY85_02346 [Firmicutes bacterium ADurb.Bin506]
MPGRSFIAAARRTTSAPAGRPTRFSPTSTSMYTSRGSSERTLELRTASDRPSAPSTLSTVQASLGTQFLRLSRRDAFTSPMMG